MEEKRPYDTDPKQRVEIVGGHPTPEKDGIKIVGGGPRPDEITTLDKQPEPTKEGKVK